MTFIKCFFSEVEIKDIMDTVCLLSSWEADGDGSTSKATNQDIGVQSDAQNNGIRTIEVHRRVSLMCYTCMGSLAGTPLADLVYSVAMSAILSKKKERRCAAPSLSRTLS